MAADAGVEYLRVEIDGSFEVRFPAPQSAPARPVNVPLPLAGKVVHREGGELVVEQPAPPASAYHALFRGKMPTLGKAE